LCDLCSKRTTAGDLVFQKCSGGNNRLSYLSGVGGGNFLIKKSAVHEVSRLHYALHSVRHTTGGRRTAAHRKLDQRRDDLCAFGLRKRVQESSMTSWLDHIRHPAIKNDLARDWRFIILSLPGGVGQNGQNWRDD